MLGGGGKRHPAYKNGSGRPMAHIGRRLIDLSTTRCANCKTSKRLIIHHINGNYRDNNIENLQVLCRNCHRRLHWSAKKMTDEQRREKHLARLEKAKQEKIKKQKDAFFAEFKNYDYKTSKDLCKILGVSREYIRQLRGLGKIKFIKVEGRYLHTTPYRSK